MTKFATADVYATNSACNSKLPRIVVGSSRSRQPPGSPFFRLARQAVCSTMVTNNVCRFIILSISVQTKKGMSEDSTHRKPLLYLGARRVICRWHITKYKTTAMRCLVLRLREPKAKREFSIR